MKAIVSYAQRSQGKFRSIQNLATALHGVFALISQRESKFQSNLCTTTTLRKWQGDHYIQGDPYTQVNFAANIRQPKFWEVVVTVIYRVTAIYRAVIYWSVFTGMTSFQGLNQQVKEQSSCCSEVHRVKTSY